LRDTDDPGHGSAEAEPEAQKPFDPLRFGSRKSLMLISMQTL